MQNLKIFWQDLFSCNVQKVSDAYILIDSTEKLQVRNHFPTIIQEKGWHADQVKSVKFAVQIFEVLGKEEF